MQNKQPKIVLLPLDERPCNYDYPRLMPKTACALVLPPKSMLSQKKKAADTAKIAAWLLEQTVDADALVVSLDMLIYGGILPSRLHQDSAEDLMKKANLLRQIKQCNPKIRIFAFELIMRCPKYSSGEEEPDYYAECGAELFLYGKYTHEEKLGLLTEADRADFQRVQSKIKLEYLQDFTKRRQTNLAVLMHNLQFVSDGTVEYFIIPQDDAAEHGFTAMDQMVVRSYLKANTLHAKTAMYPSADDTGLTLLARAVAKLSGYTPKIYVHYASEKGAFCIPQVEDRMLGETVKYHVLSVGGVQVYSLPEADLLLAVNVGSQMLRPGDPACSKAYDIERNLAEFVQYIGYALEMGKGVAVADVAWLNRADTELTQLMRRADLLLRVQAYAGWNTSSNTIGTALCQAVLYTVGQDTSGNQNFLLHRYFEDIGYMAYARQYILDEVLPATGLDRNLLDGVEGKVAAAAQNALWQYMQAQYPELCERVEALTVKLPWNRTFEADVKLKSK